MDQQALRAVGDVFPRAGALLTTFVRSAVVVGSAVQSEGAGPPGGSPAELQAFTREMEARVHKTTLTLLLLDESPRLAVVPTRNTTITPFFGTGWGAGGTPWQLLPLEQRGRLTREHLKAVATTAALVMDHYSDALAIPTRRFASALLTRIDVEDGLVDAVVGWESLFAGTDQGELSFRIAAAMAWLIEPDSDERVAVHREITRLYGLRSQILHRGRASRDVRLERDRAVDLGLKAVRALLAERPDLVDNENRGKALILGGRGRRSRPAQADPSRACRFLRGLAAAASRDG